MLTHALLYEATINISIINYVKEVKIYFKNVKQEAHGPQSSPELQFQITITCYLDWIHAY